MKIPVRAFPVALFGALVLAHLSRAQTINGSSFPGSAQSSPQTIPPAPKVADEDGIRQEEKTNEEVVRSSLACMNRGDLDAYVDYWDLDAKNFNVAMGREGNPTLSVI